LFITQKNYREDSIKFFVKLDKKGRIVIPAEVRRSLGIKPNDILIIFFSLKEGIRIAKYDKESVSFSSANSSSEGGEENEQN